MAPDSSNGSGILGAGCTLAWILMARDTPEEHPWVSAQELAHIQHHRGRGKQRAVPWLSLISSRAVWVLALTKFCTAWAFNILQMELSTYLNSVLHFSLSMVSCGT
ncbi:hypothetical protein LAZ67_1007464 [Cordylochernes scorpioides]|uniref:Uncharacterized protein n=1 Tax=Cordylochernes scorpioides TaxID=51811 RepID=A0ABY6K125_9ARAC|nr:hypothetical protein LAZ67_1007464 [Cordylochernes scorpioides]